MEKERRKFLNSIVSMPKLKKNSKNKVTRDQIINSLRRGVRNKKLESIYKKMNKAFKKRRENSLPKPPQRFSLSID